MLSKKLFSLTIFFSYSCFAMDNSTMREELAIDARPIHCFLTTNLRDKDEGLSKEARDGLTSLIKTCQKYKVDPHLLFDLPDKRNSNATYLYRCPEEQEMTVQYIHPINGKDTRTIRRNAYIQGLPTAVSVTTQGRPREKYQIKLIDSNSWFSGRTYNLPRLLFDCDRAHEALAILNATKQDVGNNSIHRCLFPDYLQLAERYKSDPDWVEKHKPILKELENKFNRYEVTRKEGQQEEEVACCNKSLRVSQVVLGAVAVFSGHDKSIKLGMAATAALFQFFKREEKVHQE